MNGLRNATTSLYPTWPAIAATCCERALQVAVAVRALALGLFPAKGAPSVVIHVVLGALFAVALARTRVPAATSARSA